jgi:hypothetical protein
MAIVLVKSRNKPRLRRPVAIHTDDDTERWLLPQVIGWAAQDAALHAAGCAKVYGEKQSGAKTERAELAKLLRRLEPGDVLMVTRLDRLARSTRDLLNILHTLGERGVGFKSAGRQLGRHDNATWPPARHDARRHCRVRARADPRAYGRGQDRCQPHPFLALCTRSAILPGAIWALKRVSPSAETTERRSRSRLTCRGTPRHCSARY